MYMREMGTVDLLTREGEIRIAKRIEQGLNQALRALSAYPNTVMTLCDAYALHEAWPNSDLQVVAKDGHALSEPGITKELLTHMDMLRDLRF